jgi:hypothetical protein
MDIIYRNTEVTIIAAAGNGADCGLAGVCVARQNLQALSIVDGISLASFPLYPWGPIWDSTWDSRGWTYQECFFSRRRIFFTEQQAVLDCLCE